jgi:hypothetical protein
MSNRSRKPSKGKSEVRAPAPAGNGEATPAPAPSPIPSPVPAPEGAPTVPNPFNVEALRLPVDYAVTGKILLRIPHRKPDKSWFVRAHSDPAYRITVGVIELPKQTGIGKEVYLVLPALCEHLAQQEACFSVKLLVTAISRQGIVFLWEASLPRDAGSNGWVDDNLEAIARAEKEWVRVTPNRAGDGYDITPPPATMPEPEWPPLSLSELLGLAFKGCVIDSLDHHVLRKLRGEA